jgi:3-dehydroquinate synthase
MSETVQVELSERSYPIVIDAGVFSGSSIAPSTSLRAVIQRVEPLKHALVISDHQVLSTARTLANALEANGIRVSLCDVPSGERSKSIVELDRLWNWMLDEKADRKSVVFAVGGGVIGDLAGFVAASFARGLRFVQVPTSLLAMVDSSVGGKTGINLEKAKNIIGAFWQPQAVIIDTDQLATLPAREYFSGLAEVVKYGMIMDAAFMNRLEVLADKLLDRDADALREIIAHSCRCKAAVVKDDERETTGLRAILNYGHTFAHAIEATAGYGKLLHGEAVSIGMAMAGQLAVSLGMIDQQSITSQNNLLSELQLPIDHSQFDLAELWTAMQSDKKVELGRLGFILPTRIGEVKRVEGISLNDLSTALR